MHGGTLARLPYGGEARILGPRSEIFIGIERLLQRGASCYSAILISLAPGIPLLALLFASATPSRLRRLRREVSINNGRFDARLASSSSSPHHAHQINITIVC